MHCILPASATFLWHQSMMRAGRTRHEKDCCVVSLPCMPAHLMSYGAPFSSELSNARPSEFIAT